jgi:predicted transcriptional regulator
MKYRSRTEIVSMILEAGNGGATKTRIMYKAFLSFAQLREYLSLLVENNLLEYLEGAKIYKTTEKGLNFLKMHNEISELLQTTIRVKNSTNHDQSQEFYEPRSESRIQ